MARAGGDVIGLDWRIPLDDGWALVGESRGVQGNLDPYDRDIGDLFAMQDEITTNLSAAIATEIVRAEASAPARPTNDITAWDRFLKGLSHYYRQTKEDLTTAVDLFREVIALVYLAADRACLSRHDPDPEHPVRLGQGHARNVGRGDGIGLSQRPARPALLFCVLDPVLGARAGRP